MHTIQRPQRNWRTLGSALLLGTCAFALHAGFAAAIDIKLALTGDQEVPPVKSEGSGTGFFAVSNDMAITGSVTTKGIMGTAAHIHQAAPGANGPVIIPLTKNGDTYSVPANARLSDAQSAALTAGTLYVNVHTAANPGGELRAQLKP